MVTFVAKIWTLKKDSDARRQYLTVKSLSTESAKSSASSRGSDTSPGHKSFGGSYSSKPGGKTDSFTIGLNSRTNIKKIMGWKIIYFFQ